MTTKIVDIAEAQSQLAELIAQAATGIEIILTDRQIPQARLLPIQVSSTKRVPGLHRNSIIIDADFDDPLPDEFWLNQQD